MPERLEKEQSVNSNLVFPSPNLPEPLDKKRGVDNNLVFSSPNLPEPLDKEQGVDSNLAFSSPSLPGSTDKGQDVDNSLRFSAKNIAETLAKEQDVVKNFSSWSLPAEPLYKERDTGTDFKLSAPTSDCQSVESESRDRPDTELPGQQKALLQDVINNTPTGSRVVLILFNAGPVNISFADSHPKVCAIIECFFPVQATGEALQLVIFSDVIFASPAGRLPFTWPVLTSQIPPMVNYSMQGRTYRFFEGDPLYLFDYGLTYTTFEYLDLILLVFVDAGQPLTGSVVVANKGKLDADEVVQVYIRWKDSSLPAPKIQLAWFQRVMVSAGQQLEVPFEIEAKIMALWIDDGWFVKPGPMDLFVGGQKPFQKRAVPGNVFASSFQIMGIKFLGRY